MTGTDDAYEVTIVRYGTRETLRSAVFLNYGVYGEPDGPIRMDYYFWVVRNSARTFLVDTGYNECSGANRGRTMLISPSAALAELDVDPDRATVILTHLHYDHAGNLDLFPNSTVIASATEYEFWTGPYARRRLYHHAVDDRDIENLQHIRADGRLHLHGGGSATIAPGIELIEVGGHSPGQCIVMVNTTDGPVLVASDATHFYEQIERDMPFHVVTDLRAMYAGFDRMKDIVHQYDAILLPGHDPAVFDRHRRCAGPLARVAASIGGAAVPP